MKVLIDRSKWRTGRDGENKTGDGTTMLRNNQGYLCCLGFICEAFGVSPERTIRHFLPRWKHRVPFLMEEDGYTDLATAAVSINDSLATPASQKEMQLLELFRDTEVELGFTGEYSRDSD